MKENIIDAMEKRHQEALRKNWIFLMDNLILDDLLDIMQEKEIFTTNMAEEVNVKATRKEKATHFLFTLIRRGPKAFDIFIEALRETDQGFIADKVLTSLNEEMDTSS